MSRGRRKRRSKEEEEKEEEKEEEEEEQEVEMQRTIWWEGGRIKGESGKMRQFKMDL